MRAEPKIVTAFSTDASVSNPSINSPMMRNTRHGSVLVKSTRGPDCCRSFSSSVTGEKSRMASSIVRVVTAGFAGLCCDGGVRPALRCPSSVLCLSPSSAFFSAEAITSGLSFLPPAVRARVDRMPPGFVGRALDLSFLFFIGGRWRGLGCSLHRETKLRGSAQSPPGDGAQVVMIIADGVRPDALGRSIDGGHLPALAALREEGHLSTITSAFPSVTGPAYAPFLMGRYPGSIGLPGLRWYDRSRRIARLSGHARSYVGPEMRFVDRDIDRASPTIFELAKPSLGALSVIGRGLRRRERIGQSPAFVARAAATHFRGNVRGWLAIDRLVGEEAALRLRTQRTRFAFIALTGIDKTSHAEGHDAQIVSDAMRIVDDTVAQIRSDAERDGRWKKMSLWVGSDHGHSPVREHEDLVALLSEWGYSTLSHPWAFNTSADIAVMVSGNAMAHLYLNIDQKTRPWWPALGGRWNDLSERLLSRQSVDLLILPTGPASCEIRGRGRGSATLAWSESRYSLS